MRIYLMAAMSAVSFLVVAMQEVTITNQSSDVMMVVSNVESLCPNQKTKSSYANGKIILMDVFRRFYQVKHQGGLYKNSGRELLYVVSDCVKLKPDQSITLSVDQEKDLVVFRSNYCVSLESRKGPLDLIDIQQLSRKHKFKRAPYSATIRDTEDGSPCPAVVLCQNQ